MELRMDEDGVPVRPVDELIQLLFGYLNQKDSMLFFK